MRFRDRRIEKQPELMIIPMIDIMFFLLVFFMLATIYMVEMKTIPIKLPTAVHSSIEQKSSFAISLKADGSIWLEDKPTNIKTLLMQAKLEQKRNPNFAVIIRADKNIDYGKVVNLLDQMRGAGVSRFGLATDTEHSK